ncbi:MAG: Phosphoribosyl isomerase A [Candidatus Omnitrophica bacterium ADurb.Bin277]|nr:MAG: Phosphoribosyl isomerase A [Candidatus Omnitrophica bacterium ADurb.Bin277]
MNLYPAIDLYQGKVVRLTRGDYGSRKVYSNDPAATAREWEAAGAQWIHVVDLEGAKSGVLTNHVAIASICKAVRARVQCGGGLRSLETIKEVLDSGVSRVVLGTKALDFPFLEQCVKKFRNQIAVGLDAGNGIIKTAGWTRDGNMTLEAALELCDRAGVRTVIYTDIEKDGVLQGPNFGKLPDVLSRTKARVILSGGVARLSDIERCASVPEENFEGVIIGKALYEKRFTLTEAFQCISKNKNQGAGT